MIKHILISRTDNMGDVILTLPLAGVLKNSFPGVKISFLARDYVRSIVEHCANVDEFISWDALSLKKESDAAEEIRAQQFDVAIHAFPKKEIARLIKKSGVPCRIGTSRRLYHWLTCNERVNFSRIKSNLHEAQLNLNLLKPLNIEVNNDLNYLSEQIGLRFEKKLSAHLQSFIKPDHFNLIIHPFTSGHTREWPVSHFIALIQQLPRERVNIIVTGSQKEANIIYNRIMPQCSHVMNAAGKCNLNELMQLIRSADGLLANSTGPLHLAAALGIHALGLYPFRKGIDPNRWKPIGKKAKFLVTDPNCNVPGCHGKNDCFCMESITVDQVKNVITRWIL
ncbi:MAG: glycosyltransferase family 9 protein [Gammaproteobacteria bacterium]|nr:glycosyltransferase family 9 protein [Gammaproteobacteria bacterium]